jgi:hypothetical protein
MKGVSGGCKLARVVVGRTPDEQLVIDSVARDNGQEWAEAHAGLILIQARSIGTLPVRSAADQAVADMRAAFDAYRKNMLQRRTAGDDPAATAGEPGDPA